MLRAPPGLFLTWLLCTIQVSIQMPESPGALFYLIFKKMSLPLSRGMLCGGVYQPISFIASAFIIVFIIIIKKMLLPYHMHSTKAGALSWSS